VIKEWVLVAVLLVPAQCVYPSDRSVGGDNNPATGACLIEFEETVAGEHHRYPYLASAELRLVIGKAIMTCERPPASQHATADLETRKPGAGQEWRSRYQISSARVPRPKEALFVKASCDRGTVAYWRVHLRITGTLVQADGRSDHFDEDAASRETRIECP
jgi:hypothetical protein